MREPPPRFMAVTGVRYSAATAARHVSARALAVTVTRSPRGFAADRSTPGSSGAPDVGVLRQQLADRIVLRTKQRSSTLNNNTAVFNMFRTLDRRGMGEITYGELARALQSDVWNLPWSDRDVRELCTVRAAVLPVYERVGVRECMCARGVVCRRFLPWRPWRWYPVAPRVACVHLLRRAFCCDRGMCDERCCACVASTNVAVLLSAAPSPLCLLRR